MSDEQDDLIPGRWGRCRDCAHFRPASEWRTAQGKALGNEVGKCQNPYIWAIRPGRDSAAIVVRDKETRTTYGKWKKSEGRAALLVGIKFGCLDFEARGDGSRLSYW